MTAPRYVQHKDLPNGTKWEVTDSLYNSGTGNDDNDWQVRSGTGRDMHYLPRSEYVLCSPPERWVNVTKECRWRGNRFIHSRGDGIGVFVSEASGYRVTCTEVETRHQCGKTLAAIIQAFIVERREDCP